MVCGLGSLARFTGSITLDSEPTTHIGRAEPKWLLVSQVCSASSLHAIAALVIPCYTSG